MVGSYVDADGLYHSYVRAPDGSFISLDLPLPQTAKIEYLFVHSISDAGVIVAQGRLVGVSRAPMSVHSSTGYRNLRFRAVLARRVGISIRTDLSSDTINQQMVVYTALSQDHYQSRKRSFWQCLQCYTDERVEHAFPAFSLTETDDRKITCGDSGCNSCNNN